MNKKLHKIYIFFFFTITVLVLAFLIYNGYDYYTTPLDKRFFLPNHNTLKPSGFLGHGFGIIGTFLMSAGVAIYMIRKRVKIFSNFGALKYWLELHIFLCTIGPILVLFHTAFKFGGIVSISFWSMVMVFLSGVVGRFIYIRIPRTIEGEELNIEQINRINENLSFKLMTDYKIDKNIIDSIELFNINMNNSKTFKEFIINFIPDYLSNKKKIKQINKKLKTSDLPKKKRKEINKLIKEKLSIQNKINYLKTMQNLFRYWHVAHLPFAIIMLIIMIVHVTITVTFGYKWIF